MEQYKLKRFYTGVMWTFVRLGNTYRKMFDTKLWLVKDLYTAAYKLHEQRLLSSELPAIFDVRSNTKTLFSTSPMPPVGWNKFAVEKIEAKRYAVEMNDIDMMYVGGTKSKLILLISKLYRFGIMRNDVKNNFFVKLLNAYDKTALDIIEAELKPYQMKLEDKFQNLPRKELKVKYSDNETSDTMKDEFENLLSEYETRADKYAKENPFFTIEEPNWQFDEDTRVKIPDVKIAYKQSNEELPPTTMNKRAAIINSLYAKWGEEDKAIMNKLDNSKKAKSHKAAKAKKPVKKKAKK